MKPVESEPQGSNKVCPSEVDSTGLEANGDVTEVKPPPLSAAAESYLLELEAKCSPIRAYELVSPSGVQFGDCGLTSEYPALALDYALMVLESIFRTQNFQSDRECRGYWLREVEDPFGVIKYRYIKFKNGNIKRVRTN